MARRLPSDEDRLEALRRLLSGLADGADVHELTVSIAPLHPKNNTFPGEVFMVLATQWLITATEEDKTALGEAGFVSAILDTRFFPSEPGAEHVRGDPHIATLVLQFSSEGGATDAVDLLHTDGLEPCPETCAFAVEEFEIDGVSNGRGIQRIAMQEALDRIGDVEHPPHAEYSFHFVDGLLAYDVRLSGPPDEVSLQQAEEIVTKLYERVQGAPPPPEG